MFKIKQVIWIDVILTDSVLWSFKFFSFSCGFWKVAGNYFLISKANCLLRFYSSEGNTDHIQWKFNCDANQIYTELGEKLLLLFSCSAVSDSLWPHGLQHTRLPCPSPSPVIRSHIESVIPSNHLILFHPVLLLPSILPSIRVFSNISKAQWTPSRSDFLLLFNCSVVVQLFATPWTAAWQASLSFTTSWSFLKLKSIESVMPFNYLTPFSLCPQSFLASRNFSVVRF